MTREPENIFDSPYIFRLYRPEKTNGETQVFLLIHGWIGNEYSTSVFHNALPKNSFFISPRGPFHIDENKYGWVNIRTDGSNDPQKYKSVGLSFLDKLNHFIDTYIPSSHSQQRIHCLGFSQGAAMAATLTFLDPSKFNKIALLAGFLPGPFQEYSKDHLSANTFFVAHGKNDSLVEFNEAVKLKNSLENHGGVVHFCAEDIGHKVGPSCMLSLKKFFFRS